VQRDHASDRPRPSRRRADRGLLLFTQPRNWDEWNGDKQFIEDVMRFLDNVLQDFIDRAPEGM
jgi:hypothetical protein